MYLQALLQPGAAHARPSRGSRATRSTSRTRWWRCRTRRRASSATRPADEDAKKPFVEVSGRKGLGRQGRRPARPADRQGGARGRQAQSGAHAPTSAGAIGAQIAVAAVRYFMLKFSRGKLIVFDIEEALSFEGETGPYLQYAVVRAEQHLRQAAGARRRRRSRRRCARSPTRRRTRSTGGRTASTSSGRWSSRRHGSTSRRAGRPIARILGAGEVHVRAGAGVQRVLPSRPRSSTRSARTCGGGARPASAYVRAQLTRALDLMGIEVPATDVDDVPRSASPAARSSHDYVEADRARSAASRACSIARRRARRAARRHRRPAADRRRRRRAGAATASRRIRPYSTSRSRARRVRDRARARGARPRPADPRDLPRHPGAERRLRRHAGPGHPVRGAGTLSPTASTSRKAFPAHEVWPSAGSMLAALLGADASPTHVEVNSRHHQAVKAVAPGFRVSATAPDGVIEAIEIGAARVLPRRPVAPGELRRRQPVPSTVPGPDSSRQLPPALTHRSMSPSAPPA